MGAYVDQADLVPAWLTSVQLVELSQDDVSVITVDDDVVDGIILQAEAEVDGYLGARHSLPLASVPVLVKNVTARLVRFYLYGRRPNAVTEQLDNDYKNAVRLLRDLSSGVVTLGVQPELAANTERVIKTDGHTRVYSREKLKDF